MSLGDKLLIPEIPLMTLFQKIGDICATVNTVTTNQELLEISLKKILELFQAKRGSIFLLDDNGKDLVLKIAYGMKMTDQAKLVKHLGEGVVGRVAVIKKPVVVEDISQDSRFQDYKARQSYDTSSFICVPLLIKDKLMGVINITDKESGHRFNHDELQLLDFLASQIALNYRRIQLYHKFKEIIKESQTLKVELGKTSEEAQSLKRQIVVQEKLASLGKLFGGIAHEFNNPLDGVIRYTNLSLEHVKEDEVVRGYLLEIKHGLNRMANIVKSLLACSRHTIPSRHKVEVGQVIEQAITSVQSDISRKGIRVERHIQERLPPMIDLGLELIVLNLLRNAIDAVDRNGKITVVATCPDRWLKITVSDTGCGISEDEVPRIFEPFYTTKEIDKGFGLGLTIVHEIVKSYNGKIDIRSAPQKGATFTITIPLEFESAQKS